MRVVLATITSKGQVTIPKDVCERLGLRTNDKVAFVLEDDGTVRLQVLQYPTVSSFASAAGSLECPLSWEEMREIARQDRLAAQHESMS